MIHRKAKPSGHQFGLMPDDKLYLHGYVGFSVLADVDLSGSER